MKVAFCMREDYMTNKGGDTFQMLKTKEYLEMKDDIEINIITTPEELNEDFDIVHIFNLQTIELAYIMTMTAKKYGIKIVLSPIIWRFGDAGYVNKMMRLTHSYSITKSFRILGNIFEYISIHNKLKMKKEILKNADMVLPNSPEEGKILYEQYGVKFNEKTVPNCIDVAIKGSALETSDERKMILQVGRIEPTKNQMAVVLALMNDKDIPLYFIGKQNNRKKFYINKLKKLAKKRGNTYFIEELPPEKLVNYYKTAKVHILPSYRESPGLVTLEALYYGCNIVASSEKYCPVEYYMFNQVGHLCNPYSLKSIRKALLDAYNSPTVEVPEDYFEIFNYKNAAKITREAYEEVLG